MKLKEIVSCFLSKVYLCTPEEFTQTISSFEKYASSFEGGWKEVQISENKTIFKKGSEIALTFDYSGTKLEVQVHFEYIEEAGYMKVSVGNTGFPFEPLLSKSRYSQLLEELHEFIHTECALDLANPDEH